jgi:hypothetical protein
MASNASSGQTDRILAAASNRGERKNGSRGSQIVTRYPSSRASRASAAEKSTAPKMSTLGRWSGGMEVDGDRVLGEIAVHAEASHLGPAPNDACGTLGDRFVESRRRTDRTDHFAVDEGQLGAGALAVEERGERRRGSAPDPCDDLAFDRGGLV